MEKQTKIYDSTPQLQENNVQLVNHQANDHQSLEAIGENKPIASAPSKLWGNFSSIAPPIQKKTNKTGLPAKLKAGVEHLSGIDMSDVKVHYNSSKPAQLQAHAFAQGTDIHIAPQQEKYLAHEAWHVVQQKQGRVQPTMQMKGKVNVNDDMRLEREADVMGAKASQLRTNYSLVSQLQSVSATVSSTSVIQGAFMDEAKIGLELTFNSTESKEYVTNNGFPIGKEKKAENWWKRTLNNWEQSFHPDISWEQTIIKDYKNKKLETGDDVTGQMNNWRFIYRNDEGEIVFWWHLSMDPGVIEIQTYPVTGSEMRDGEIGIIIEKIYSTASELGFSPGGGGGHVNVDFETGFGLDYSLIPKIIEATDIVIQGLRDSDSSKNLVDFENEKEDPFISTDRIKMKKDGHGGWSPSSKPASNTPRDYRREWKQDVVEKRKVTNKDNLKKFRDAHAKWLLLHPTLAQYQKASDGGGKITGKANEEGLLNVLHYQAVNIDHLFEKIDDEGSDPRRLEFRFFKGQENIDAIIASIELISRIVTQATSLS